MFTIIFLYFRALFTGVKIHGYGDFRNHFVNSMDIWTFIFIGLVIAFGIYCLIATIKLDREKKNVVRTHGNSWFALLMLCPFILATTENANNMEILNNARNTFIFVLGILLLIGYLTYVMVKSLKKAKANVFLAFRQFFYMEALVTGFSIILYRIFNH